MTALIVVIAMIAVGATAVLSVDEAGTVRTGAQSTSPFIPSVVPSPSDTIGSDLLVVDPETWDETLVAMLPGRQSNGERSPDGRWIAYTERPGGTAAAQVFLLRADGKAHRLTHLGGAALDPTWSPDGRRIAFASNGREGSDIFVMGANGTGVRWLTGTPGSDSAPDWSPDGKRIVFQSDWRGGRARPSIWVASVRGGEPTQLTDAGDGDSYPTWSPEGDRILFLRYDRYGGQLEVSDSDFFLMRPNGTGLVRLVAGEGPLPPDAATSGEWGMTSPDNHFQGPPTWSPDGRSVAYSGGHCDCITIVDVASGEIVNSINGKFDNVSWDHDGILANRRSTP